MYFLCQSSAFGSIFDICSSSPLLCRQRFLVILASLSNGRHWWKLRVGDWEEKEMEKLGYFSPSCFLLGSPSVAPSLFSPQFCQRSPSWFQQVTVGPDITTSSFGSSSIRGLQLPVVAKILLLTICSLHFQHV